MRSIIFGIIFCRQVSTRFGLSRNIIFTTSRASSSAAVSLSHSYTVSKVRNRCTLWFDTCFWIACNSTLNKPSLSSLRRQHVQKCARFSITFVCLALPCQLNKHSCVVTMVISLFCSCNKPSLHLIFLNFHRKDIETNFSVIVQNILEVRRLEKPLLQVSKRMKDPRLSL